jgi:hypothetical protein
MKILATILGGIILAIGIVVLLGLLFSWPVLLLWNGCLVGTVAGISPLTSIWHAWGILILCGLLFRSSSVSSKSKD